MTIEGESRNVIDERQRELGVVRRGISGGYNPTTPAVDVAQLLASGLAHLARARRLRGAAGAWLQAAQLALVEDPTPMTEAAVRRARQALDASEADEDLAGREVASYQLRVWQARTDEEADD